MANNQPRAKRSQLTVIDVYEDLSEFKAAAMERLGRLEEKTDIVIDLMSEDRKERAQERQQSIQGRVATAHEEQKTERVRIGSRARVVVAVFTALGAILGGGVVAALVGACS